VAEGGVMRRQAGTLRVALAFAALVGSLGLVVWRQGRALEQLRALDAIRGARTVEEAERSELVRRVEWLASRGRVVEAARERLGLRVPSGVEIVILSLGRDDAPTGRDAAPQPGGLEEEEAAGPRSPRPAPPGVVAVAGGGGDGAVAARWGGGQ
jgi:hypothetical protein